MNNQVKNPQETNENKWYIPKNIPIYNQVQIKNLTVEEKDKYEKIKKAPKKIGRYIEVRGFANFYRISPFDFLPFFLGSIYSLIRLIIAYGDAKRTVNFNKKMMWDFKNNLLISLTFGFFFWPLLVVAIIILYPYLVYDTSEVTKAWYALIDEWNRNGISGIGDGINAYYVRAVAPLFEPGMLTNTLVHFAFISAINVQTFLFFYLYKFNRKVLFEIQKNDVREKINFLQPKK